MNPFRILYTVQFVLMLVCAGAYYRAAEVERASGVLWAGLSVGVFLLTWMVLGWGWVGCLLGQVGLLGAITVVRMMRRA